jgi:hypothetical protein
VSEQPPNAQSRGDMRTLLGTMDTIHEKVDALIDVAGDIVEAIGGLRSDVRAEADNQRTAGDLRGQLLRSQVEGALSHHDARLDANTQEVRRVTEATSQDRGAPWRLVYLLLGANAVGAMGFLALLLLLLHLYSQVTGSNPAAAFHDTKEMLPVITGQSSEDKAKEKTP